MINKVALFKKVSFEQFKKDMKDLVDKGLVLESNLLDMYTAIKLPTRATSGSAGYDFYSPLSFSLVYKDPIVIPTGIRCEIANGWMLAVFPKSGLGFKHKVQLYNTVGIIDSDYYDSDNEGHIKIKIVKDSSEIEILKIEQGKGFAQGIFIPFGITFDDDKDEKEVRNGGFGSTEKR